MAGTKKKSRRKNQSRANSNASSIIQKSTRSTRVTTKNLEVFVTDFLTNPCGLPVELRDYILVDGTTFANNCSGILHSIKSYPSACLSFIDTLSSNNTQVLKKIFTNNESMECNVKNSTSFGMEGVDSLKKINV